MDNKKKLLLIVGPTAVGKTSISIGVAKKKNGEIISADSMQIYKYMDIGTAKITLDEMEGIPHYMLDIVYPNEEFTVVDFKRNAEKYIEMINKANKLPILVAGTGLYLNSIVYQLNFTEVKSDEEFRRKYFDLANAYGNQYIHDELFKVDSISANQINVNDRQRIIRALEIFYKTGKPMSYYNKDFRKKTDKYNLIMIGLTMDRARLYNRINKRVDMMIKKGLIDEVKDLIIKGYNKNLVSMQAIGYKEIISYLDGERSLEEAIEILKRNTRRYAKRQLTWFRRDRRLRWIDIDKYDSNEKIVEEIVSYI